MNYLIESFGEYNESIDDDLLNDIFEEIESSFDYNDYYELAIIAIKLGKPQILEYLVNKTMFNTNQINSLKSCIEDYVNDEDNDFSKEIAGKFETIIKTAENKKKWNPHKRG